MVALLAAIVLAASSVGIGSGPGVVPAHSMVWVPRNSRPALLLTSLPSPSSPSSITPQAGPTFPCGRTSTGTYQPTATTLATAAANTCRVDYRGLLVEGLPDGGAVANMLAAPLDISSASWTKQHTPTIVANQCVFPDGTTTMGKITGFDTVSAVVQSEASLSSGLFTLSGWASTSTTGPSFDIERSGGTAYSECTCAAGDTYTCAPGGTADCLVVAGGAISSTPERMQVTVNEPAATTNIFIEATPGLRGDANNTGAVACEGGFQFETNGFATSFIPNGTRATDVIDAFGGTLVSIGTHPSFSSTVNLEGLQASSTAMDLTDGTNSWTLAVNSSGNAVCSYNANSDTTVAFVAPNSASLVQCSYDGSAIHTCIDGICHQTSAIFTPAESFNHLYLGSASGLNPLDGFISTACAGASGTCKPGAASAGSVATSGLVYQFDALNVDGLNNATITNGETIATWTNLGSGSSGTAPVDSQPIFMSGVVNGEPALNFAGNNQSFDLGTVSKSAAAFIHNTGVFDAFFVVESDRFVGNDPLFDDGTLNTGATGSSISTDSSGHLQFKIDSAGTLTTTAVSPWSIPLFTWEIVEANGDGARVGLSNDLVNYKYTALGSLPAGNSTTDAFIAQNGGAVLGWNGNIQEVLIYNRKLTSAERASLKSWLRARAGL